MDARTAGRISCAFALVLLAAGVVRATPPEPLGPCGPIDRLYDPIELPASRFGRLANPPIGRLGLLAVRGGVAQPIPFQVDERRGHKLALTGGREPTTDDHPGVFDPDDVVVFMACDAGDAAPADTLARALTAAGTVTTTKEIRIEDPLDHRTGFVYLVVADRPPTTERRYVDYDPAHDVVMTAGYRIGLVQALPVYFALSLEGSLGPNLIDGARMRADATLKAGLAKWTFNEREGHNELLAWKIGPVRVVRRSRHHVHLGMGIYLSAGVAHTYFYSQHVYGPGSMKLPFSPGVFFRDINALGGADLRDLRGWRYRAPGAPAAGFPVDGQMDGAEQRFHARGTWFLVENGHEAVMVAATVSENLASVVPLELVYVDDAARRAPPEEVPGSVPLVGFRGQGIQRLGAGRYTFALNFFGLRDYQPGAEARVLAQLGTGLTANVSDPSPPAAAPAAHR